MDGMFSYLIACRDQITITKRLLYNVALDWCCAFIGTNFVFVLQETYTYIYILKRNGLTYQIHQTSVDNNEP